MLSLCLTVFAAVTALGTEPLTTVASVRRLSAQEMDERRPVDFEGRVVARTYSGGILFEDETGSFIVEDARDVSAEAGDIVRIRGITYLDHAHGIRQESVRLRSCERKGRGPRPEPIDVTAADIIAGKADFRFVRVRGAVIDAFPDEMDPSWNCLFLRDGEHSLYVAVPNDRNGRSRLAELIDAEVTLVGAGFPHYAAQRMFIGPHLELASFDGIRIDRPAAADPFSSPPLENIDHASVADIAAMRRRSVSGEVLAAWRGERFLVREDSGRVIRAEQSEAGRLPQPGERVRVVGFPESDVFKINLTAVLWRSEGAGAGVSAPPEDVSAADLLFDKRGERQVKPEYHGRLLRLKGVVRTVRQELSGWYQLVLDCERVLVPVEIGADPQLAETFEAGAVIEVTGVCIMDIVGRRSRTHFPETDGFLLVTRTPSDLVVVSRPPWWTPARLGFVVIVLLGALVGCAVWVRILNRLVERRSRELFKETAAHAGADLKLDERTRLAVELHDSISQNLTGASFQIDAAESFLAREPARAARHLASARIVLGACRRELRDCISDLRDRTLEEQDTGEAVRRALAGRTGEAAVSVAIEIPRARLSDSTFHALVRMVRELVVNAVRHGEASAIEIEGTLSGGEIRLVVRDNGRGFDPARRPGPAEGHYGLSGIEERLRHLSGEMAIRRQAAGGMEITLLIRGAK